MLEVIETVKAVSGVDFTVNYAPPVRATGGHRRQGGPDPAAIGWTPRLDDLETIVRHALDWNGAWKPANPPPEAPSHALVSRKTPWRGHKLALR